MPHRLREDRYCTNDTVYEHPQVSVTFLFNGKRIFIVKTYDDYLELKRAVTVTHRISEFELCADLYKCDMEGSDGSRLTIHCTAEDVLHNLLCVQSQLDIRHIPAICSLLAAVSVW
jgi:hypothetical protein